jgi:hypothetical protein
MYSQADAHAAIAWSSEHFNYERFMQSSTISPELRCTDPACATDIRLKHKHADHHASLRSKGT